MKTLPVLSLILGLAALSNQAAAGIATASKLAPEPKGFKISGKKDSGQKLFAESCALCHGAKGDGKGIAGAALTPKPSDFTNAAEMKARSDWRIYNVIKEGGEKVGLSPLMASYKMSLSDEKIKDLVAYVRTLAKK